MRFNIDEEIEPNLLVYRQIHIIIQLRYSNQNIILHAKMYKNEYCILHNGMITWNSLPNNNNNNNNNNNTFY